MLQTSLGSFQTRTTPSPLVPNSSCFARKKALHLMHCAQIHPLHSSPNCQDVPKNLNPKVVQVMNRKVEFLSENDTIRNAIQVFLNCGISGAPVLSTDGKLVGVLSESDVLAREAGCKLEMLNGDSTACSLPVNVSFFELLVQDYRKDKLVQLLELKVMDIMTRDPVVVEPESTLFFAANMMKENRITRLPVVKDEAVVGIITRGDLLQYMAWELLVAGDKKG